MAPHYTETAIIFLLRDLMSIPQLFAILQLLFLRDPQHIPTSGPLHLQFLSSGTLATFLHSGLLTVQVSSIMFLLQRGLRWSPLPSVIHHPITLFDCLRGFMIILIIMSIDRSSHSKMWVLEEQGPVRQTHGCVPASLVSSTWEVPS